jgi:hypothetical protein
LRGKTVIALATDGKLRLWTLSKKNKPFAEFEVVEPTIRVTEDRTQIKRRSSSAQTYKNPLTGSNSEKDTIKRGRSTSTQSSPKKLIQNSPEKFIQSSPDVLEVDKKNSSEMPEKKKSSPRFIQTLLKSSRDNSPSLPTHRSESTSHVQEKEVTYKDEKEYI